MRAPEHRVDRGPFNRPIFGLLGLRPPSAQHSRAEADLLKRFAARRSAIVEIGVAEGASAWEMRQVMDADGVLYLVDPYDMSRLGRAGPARLTAHRLVNSVARADVVWIEKPSQAVSWSLPIDFLFIDGDHAYGAVRRDWETWTPYLVPDGHVALHDARTEAPWVNGDSGPAMLLTELRHDPSWTVVGEADSLVILTKS